jgi:hypothetical protein
VTHTAPSTAHRGTCSEAGEEVYGLGGPRRPAGHVSNISPNEICLRPACQFAFAIDPPQKQCHSALSQRAATTRGKGLATGFLYGEAVAIQRGKPSQRGLHAQISDATDPSPMMCASERTSRFWSSRSWNKSGIATDLSCCTSAHSGSIGAPVAAGLAWRVA